MAWSQLLSTPIAHTTSSADLPTWYRELQQATTSTDPFSLALIGGRTSPSFSHAFLAGYQAALRALIPKAPLGLGAFCLSETNGNSPSQLQTQWQPQGLSGHKRFVTAGEWAQWLLVIAQQPNSTPAASERPLIKAVLIQCAEQTATALEFMPNPPLAFMPDLPHGQVKFAQAQGQVLPGDGWTDYSKVFRTLEDAYVLAATVAWLYQAAIIEHWPDTLIISFLGIIASLKEGLALGVQDHMAHVVLESAFMQFDDLEFELSAAMLKHQSPLLAEWKRDKVVMNLGRKARAVRLEQALSKLKIH